MKTPFLPNLLAVGLLAAAACARADYAFIFTPFNVTAPDSRDFGSSTINLLTVGTVVLGPPATNFLDTWSFQLTNSATIDSFVGTINFTGTGGSVTQGIDNLALSLVGPSGPVFGTSFAINSAGKQNSFSFLAPSGSFAPGAYSLQVRGQLVGLPSLPSSYAGTLTAMPTVVPLPAALPLLAAGLGVMAFFRRRRIDTARGYAALPTV